MGRSKSERFLLMAQVGYNPAPLLYAVSKELKVRNDSQLGLKLNICSSALSRIRKGHASFSPLNILQVQEATGWEIKKIHELLGISDYSYIIGVESARHNDRHQHVRKSQQSDHVQKPASFDTPARRIYRAGQREE